MKSRPCLTATFITLTLSGFAIRPLLAQQEAAEGASRSSGKMRVVLEEFDKVHPNGKWDAHQYAGTFEYRVRPDALVMIDRENRNQHLTRRGFQLDPKRRYAIQTLFTINEPANPPTPNSFCLNFNVAGPEDSLQSLSCWSINVDVLSSDPAKGVIKHMGFVDGRFRQIGQRVLGWCRTGVEYSLRVDVNTDQNGQFKLRTVTVTVMEGELRRERFEVDYSSFPYQPDLSKPVRIGVNTHGANWTMRNLKVSADVKPIPGKKQPAP